MAVCTFCDQEMLSSSGCTVAVMHRDAKPISMIPFGAGRWYRGRERAPARCGDCGVARGGVHHHGCDMEQCPNCGGQMIACGCWFDEDGVDIADDEDMFFDFIAGRTPRPND